MIAVIGVLFLKRQPKVEEMTGVRVGKLTVVRRSPSDGNGARWYCACDCGGSTVVHATVLRKSVKRHTASSCPSCRQLGAAKKLAREVRELRINPICALCETSGHVAKLCPNSKRGRERLRQALAEREQQQ